MSSEPRKGRKPKTAEAKAKAAVKEAEKEVEKVAKEVKQEAKKLEKTVKGVKHARTAAPRPAGKVPEPMVISRHGTGTIPRRGKGFSLGELSGAGIAPRTASSWGARIDVRRRSVLEGNVSSLKAWRSHASAATVVRRETKALESEVAGVEKEVEVAAEVVEEEVAKVEKAVKKEAKKAETKVKEKVAKKPRAKKKGDA